jgi:hypothetical protein
MPCPAHTSPLQPACFLLARYSGQGCPHQSVTVSVVGGWEHGLTSGAPSPSAAANHREQSMRP